MKKAGYISVDNWGSSLDEKYFEYEKMVRYHLMNQYKVNPMLAYDMVKMSGFKDKFYATPSLYMDTSPIKVAGLLAMKYQETHKN